MSQFKKLFEPIKLGKMELKNRVVMTPMGTGYYALDGYITERAINYFEERAKGGLGLITPTAWVGTTAFAVPGNALMHDDRLIPSYRKLVAACHKHGTKIHLQLNHAGKNVVPGYAGVRPASPSGIRSGMTGLETRELTVEEIEMIIEMFASAARRTREAGFDGVEFMCSTGYLIASFISSAVNKRTDKYGGDPIGRTTFLTEIIKRTKEECGDDFPITCRMSVIDGMPGGNSVEDSQVQAKRLEEVGVDAIQAWAGWHEARTPWMPMEVPRGAWVYLAEALKKVVKIPIMAVGRINNAELAEKILQEGKADLICVGRPLLADPDFVKKAEEGRPEEIRKCIACQRCFESRFPAFGGALKCSVNPELGRETRYHIDPAEDPKKVLVIGAGPSGMEAARVAALRGHDVHLYDKNRELGGQLILAVLPPHKVELNNIPEYFSSQFNKLTNLNLQLGKEVTLEIVDEIKPDVIILTTGSSPVPPDIPGIDQENVFSADEVLEGKATIGEKVVVIGAKLIGAETAEYLAAQGKKVTIVDGSASIAIDMPRPNRYGLKVRIRKLGVREFPRSTVETISDNHVMVTRQGKSFVLEADTIVHSTRRSPNLGLFDSLFQKVKPYNLYTAGDCLRPGMILDAVAAGSRVARII